MRDILATVNFHLIGVLVGLLELLVEAIAERRVNRGLHYRQNVGVLGGGL